MVRFHGLQQCLPAGETTAAGLRQCVNLGQSEEATSPQITYFMFIDSVRSLSSKKAASRIK